MRLILSSALVLAAAAPAFAQQVHPGHVVRRGGNGGGHVVYPNQPQPQPQPMPMPVPQGQPRERDPRGGGVVVVSPRPEGGRVIFTPPPRGGQVVIRENPRYRAPVVVQPHVVVRGEPRYYQPRVVVRSWNYRPFVVVRPYAYFAITPIYIPLQNTQYSTTLEQGEFWPQNTDYMSYYTHYSMSFERQNRYDGWGNFMGSETIMNLYPQIICQDQLYGCGNIPTPPMSRLIVTNTSVDGCGTRYVTAQSYDGTSPISYIEMKDYSRFNCDYFGGQRNELDIDRMIHADGYEEYNLSGNVSYHSWY